MTKLLKSKFYNLPSKDENYHVYMVFIIDSVEEFRGVVLERLSRFYNQFVIGLLPALLPAYFPVYYKM